MIIGTESRRIIFLSEDPDSRANVGCVNGSSEQLRINIGIFDAEGTLSRPGPWTSAPTRTTRSTGSSATTQPVNGYVDVWADSDDALYYCYGSMLDNLTSDPTTILPQVPSADMTFIPAAALAAGLEGAFFETDVDLNNAGSTTSPTSCCGCRGAPTTATRSAASTFSLAPGAGVRYANVLDEVFGLEPDAGRRAGDRGERGRPARDEPDLQPAVGQGRRHLRPGAAGHPGRPDDPDRGEEADHLHERERRRPLQRRLPERRTEPVTVIIELFNSEGESLETKTMDLPPYSNNQITRVFRNHAPITAGYVDVWTTPRGRRSTATARCSTTRPRTRPRCCRSSSASDPTQRAGVRSRPFRLCRIPGVRVRRHLGVVGDGAIGASCRSGDHPRPKLQPRFTVRIDQLRLCCH